MTLELAYAIVSATLLAFVACTWSSKVGLNLAIKTIFAAAAFAGAVMVARLLAL